MLIYLVFAAEPLSDFRAEKEIPLLSVTVAAEACQFYMVIIAFI